MRKKGLGQGVGLRLLLGLGLGLLAGCGVQAVQTGGRAGGALRGMVHGGQQPVAGATIQLYAASGSGDGFAATPLLTQSVKTNGSGEFDVTGLYTCPTAGTLVYLVATGGNPGLAAGSNNGALSLMVALGACGQMAVVTSASINEATTVAAVFALAPFMNSYGAVGSGTSDEGQLALAFQQAALLVDAERGTVPGAGLPAGVSAPIAEVNTLADVLAACVNSSGGVAGDGTACGSLFAAVKPSGSAAATETIGAALQLAKAPTNNAAGVFGLAWSRGPFEPTLTAAPASWAVSLTPAVMQLYVDAATGVHAIDPNIYGIVSYGLDPGFAAESRCRTRGGVGMGRRGTTGR